MAHALILGMTESGKTTLAKGLAKSYQASGVGVLVYDPLNDPAWPCDFKTADVEEFLDVFWGSKSCAAFIDEAGDCAGQHDKIMQKTATRGRHWGHRCHYISQRGTMISTTVRAQCSHLFLFASSLKDVKIHADEWNRPELVQAVRFKQGDYFHATRFGELSKSNIFGVKTDATSTQIDYASDRSLVNGNSDNEQTDTKPGDPAKPETRGRNR